ncbi:MAG: hypothetical protein ACRDGM_05875 [bacterium]
MTLLQLRQRVLERLDEPSGAPVYYTAAEVNEAINQGLRVFVFLTLCLERTQALTLTAGQAFYSMLAQGAFSDWFMPLRLRAGAVKVLPSKLADFRLLNERWREESGTPARYACPGTDLLCLYPPPAGGSVTITYAKSPTALTADGNTPEIPEEDHPVLADFAIWILRAKEGGLEFMAGDQGFERFWIASMARAEHVRKRSLAQGNDRMPVELTQFDMSAIVAERE